MAGQYPGRLRQRSVGAPALVWPALAGACVVVALAAGDPLDTSVIYLGVWLISTLVPGVLMWRALAGSRTVPQDVGFGAATGIGWLLLAWLVGMMVGQPWLIWLWPVGVITAFTAIPRLRAHWRSQLAADGSPTPVGWHVGMAAVCGVALVRLLTSLRVFPLPPEPHSYFRDLWYHLSAVEELSRTWRPQDPSVAGEPLRYHWFVEAHMAATQQLSGVPTQQIVLHLWIIPMLVTFLLVAGAVADRLSGRWWAGPLAAAVVGVVPVTLFLTGWPYLAFGYSSGFLLQSHTSCLAVVVMLAIVGPVSDIVRGVHTRSTWVVMALLLALGAGTKPTILPVVLAGTLVAGLVAWRVEGRTPWRLVALAGVTVALLPLATLVVTGSTGGSRLQLWGLLKMYGSFEQLTGDTSLPASGGWLVGGLDGADLSLWLLALAFIVWFASTELPRLLSLAEPLTPDGRRDPVSWWVAGCVLGGFVATFVLSHVQFSQIYFLRTVESLGAVATVALLARRLPEGSLDFRHRRALLVMVTAGVTTAALLRIALPSLDPQSVGTVVAVLLVPLGVVAAVLLAALALARRRISPSAHRPATVVLVAAFLLAAAVPGAVVESASALRYTADPPSAEPSQRQYLSRAEQAAALWLKSHADTDDVVVTNVFCSPAPYRPGCVHEAFWVSALTGRRLVLGGWAYTARNLTESSEAEISYRRSPTPWPERLRLSLGAVRQPTPHILERLQRDYDARWIFADGRATAISARLGRLADLRFRNPDVAIYELRNTEG